MVCLAPVMVYLAVLSRVNHRDNPVVVSGAWDFIGLLGGLSGFLMMGMVLFVFLVQSNARYFFREDWESLRTAWANEQQYWVLSVFGYLFIVAGMVLMAWLRRAGTLSVYNVDRADLEIAVDGALTDVGYQSHRSGNSWSDAKELIRIDPTPAFHHAAIRFRIPDLRIREELERSLRSRLAQVVTPENHSSLWLMSASVSALITLLSCLFIVAYFAYLIR